MQEYVGTCMICEKDIYCHGGFIGGVILDARILICFACHEENERTSIEKEREPG